MPINSIAEYNTNPALNTDVGGINIAENCPPGNLNNSDRQIMAHIRTWYDTLSGGRVITNIDQIISTSGSFGAAVGDNATGAPTNTGVGDVYQYFYNGTNVRGELLALQLVTGLVWRRPRRASAWVAWEQMLHTVAEGDARYGRLATTNTFSDRQTYTNSTVTTSANHGIGTASPGFGMEVQSTGGGAAFIKLHRPGIAAGLLGLDTDNVLKFGGWTFGGAWPIHHDSNSSRGAPDWVIEDQKASGTHAGTSNTLHTIRELNTEARDPFGLVSVAFHQFISIVSGWCEFSAPHHASGLARARLWNVTDGVLVANGQLANSGAGNAPGTSAGGGTIIAGKTYRIESICGTARANDGFGQAGSFGGPEVYTRVVFWRS